MPIGPIGLSYILSEVRIARTHLEKCGVADAHAAAAISRLNRAMASLKAARDEALGFQDAQRAWRDKHRRLGAGLVVAPSLPPAA